ncbi:hypothetical protein NDU88_010947 [Pleurodeles waltl]|uniref:Uncharacterized protein n=1 Tax=Pleurodeles waltl TaxID=8319 RepID=A0AAV7Q072_PLEWA|nr:hypothetical protein NDU88_010947 [Pleurodeles waltl]
MGSGLGVRQAQGLFPGCFGVRGPGQALGQTIPSSSLRCLNGLRPGCPAGPGTDSLAVLESGAPARPWVGPSHPPACPARENAPDLLEPWLGMRKQMSPHWDFWGSPAIGMCHSNLHGVRPDAPCLRGRGRFKRLHALPWQPLPATPQSAPGQGRGTEPPAPGATIRLVWTVLIAPRLHRAAGRGGQRRAPGVCGDVGYPPDPS